MPRLKHGTVCVARTNGEEQWGGNMTAIIKRMELAQIGVLISLVVALGAFYVAG
jgi:hypothetical protein